MRVNLEKITPIYNSLLRKRCWPRAFGRAGLADADIAGIVRHHSNESRAQLAQRGFGLKR
jgi:hypothetical protein